MSLARAQYIKTTHPDFVSGTEVLSAPPRPPPRAPQSVSRSFFLRSLSPLMRGTGRAKASKTKSSARSASDARSGVGHDRHSDADDEEGRPPQRPTPSARAPSAAATPSSEQGLKAPPSVALRSVPTVLLADDLRNSDRGVTETRIISESRTATAAGARNRVLKRGRQNL